MGHCLHQVRVSIHAGYKATELPASGGGVKVVFLPSKPAGGHRLCPAQLLFHTALN